MSWKNVNLIFQREVRDQLRDRRTLFMVAVLPLLLYPALGIGMVQMTVTFSEQLRRVVIVGADQMPQPSLLDGNRFDPQFFESADKIANLEVITDRAGGVDAEANPEMRKELEKFLGQVEQRRDRITRLADVQQQLDRLPPKSPQSEALLAEEKVLRQEVFEWFSEAPAQVLIVFPRDFRAQYDRVTASVGREPLSEIEANIPHPIVLHNSAHEKSEIAYQRVRQALRNWENVLLDERLKAANLPLSLPHPVPVTSVDLAEPDQIAANVWSKIFPALLVIMSVTGAFYPAIDLGAGEKERGTMETLLISPATRTEIVYGKFLTVMLFSLSTALLNLCSMGFTGQHMLSAIGSARSSPLGDLSLPPLSSLMWVVLLAIPLAALFSALSLSLAMFARSSKEGQYYLTPLLLVTMGLTMFCLNPGVELTPYYSVLPVTGPALLLKSLLLGNTSQAVAFYAFPVLVTSCVYSALALWWATEQFQREDILFREAERFSIGLWFRHLLREKEPTPSFAEAAVCFVTIAMLQFLFLTSMQGSPDLLNSPFKMVTVQLIYLIATVGVPPLFMALLLTTNIRRTLKFHWPSLSMLATAVILSITLQPIALTLMAWLDPYFPPLPAGAKQLMEAMSAQSVPLWLSLSAFALAPAICEELAFRGFILSGLQHSGRRWLPILLSALLFGVIHMIPKQQFNAALLGIVIGLLAARSGSLLPGIVFHAIFNGSQVLATRLTAEGIRGSFLRWLIRLEGTGDTAEMHFTLPCLIACGTISAALIWWLIQKDRRTRLEAERGFGDERRLPEAGLAPEVDFDATRSPTEQLNSPT
ncbi:ABC transporter permease subunit/CPBP intramembrane protease [Planctomicrobium piriforme]|uniref:Sodium transport system permease protein n=1 Tax=Planctomicrobium piriforme TaxID=1576369 RepID=A0A1I3IL60_9PLAN|nr:ABC transporter permease subunit/CPBP intramembrane protease [Planctomicrobium piriforme]SFI48662.1 sodium transport system permease protein [Planctomicrobium piriforme]